MLFSNASHSARNSSFVRFLLKGLWVLSSWVWSLNKTLMLGSPGVLGPSLSSAFASIDISPSVVVIATVSSHVFPCSLRIPLRKNLVVSVVGLSFDLYNLQERTIGSSVASSSGLLFVCVSNTKITPGYRSIRPEITIFDPLDTRPVTRLNWIVQKTE